MEDVSMKKRNIAILDGDEAHPANKVDHEKKSSVTSFNAPDMDVRSPSHEVSVSRANLCSKTCNVN